MVKKTFLEFLNELRIHDDFNIVNNLESTYLVVYKGNMYFFDYGTKDFIEKTKKFYEFLRSEGSFDLEYGFDFDSACDFFERYITLADPHIISGHFYSNSFNKKIPQDSIVLEFYKSQYLEIRISDTLKKIMTMFPKLEYFEIDDIVYHKDEIIEKYGKVFNKSERLPESVFHGTSSQFLDDILKRGIIPKKENSVFKVEHDYYIFLTTSFKSAEFYAKMSVSRDFNIKTNPVIVEIDSSKIDKDKILFDYDFYTKFIGKGNKVYDDIIKSLEPSYPSKSRDNLAYMWDKNLKAPLYKKFGYNGRILPTKIKNIYIKKGDDWELYSK